MSASAAKAVEVDQWEPSAANTAALRDEIARLGSRISIGGSIAETRRRIAASGLDPFAYFTNFLADCSKRGIVDFGELWKMGVRDAERRIVLRGFASLDEGGSVSDRSYFFRAVLGVKADPAAEWLFYTIMQGREWRRAPDVLGYLKETIEENKGKVVGRWKYEGRIGRARFESRRPGVRRAEPETESLGYRPWRRDAEIEPVEGKEKEPSGLTFSLAAKAAKARRLTLKQAAIISRMHWDKAVTSKQACKALGLSPGVERRLVENLQEV